MPFHAVPPPPVCFQKSRLQVFAVRVERGDEAARAEIGSAVADDDFAVHHPGRAGADVEHAGRNRVDNPQHLAGFRVECEQPAVERGGEDLAVLVGHAAVGAEGEMHLVRIVLPDLRIVGPVDLTGLRVYRIDLGFTAGEVDRAIDFERRGFERNLSGQVERPSEAQFADVADVDLIEPRVAGLIRRAAHRRPVIAGTDRVVGRACTARGKDKRGGADCEQR
jgi:hypothetical protein